MSMPRVLAKSLAIFALTQTLSFAATLTLNGPVNPDTGLICTPGQAIVGPNTAGTCVVGIPAIFNIFSVSLTSPTTSGGTWHLDILTNYGVALNGSGSLAVPTFSYEGKQFGMADFMIQSGSNFYAVVLTDHDGYKAGNLYQASGFQTSFQVMHDQPIAAGLTPVIDIPRPNLPAELKAGGTLLGAGTIKSASNGGNGIAAALYKVSVDFAAPIGFLSTSNFTVYASSYVCDNGFITGPGVAFPTGNAAVPEPPTWTLMIPAAAALLMRKLKKS